MPDVDELFAAIEAGNMATLRRILAEDDSLAARPDADGRTPLQVALIRGDRDALRLLLGAGAEDPDGHAQKLLDTPIRLVDRDYTGARFEGCDINDATLYRVNLRNSEIAHADLRNMQLTHVNLSNAKIDFANITGLTIYGIDVQALINEELARRGESKREPDASSET